MTANNKLQKTIKDKRYSLNLEFSGFPQRQYVLRFCGEALSFTSDVDSAILNAIIHQDNRMYQLLND